MSDTLSTKIRANFHRFTPSEKAIANYITTNKGEIAFDTATSLAKKLDLSPVTVGRFCRRLDYPHFRALKADLKFDNAGVPWLVGDQLERFVSQSKKHGEFRRSLELEVAGIVEVYTMMETPEWRRIVDLLAKSRSVYIVGFQTERAVAALLCHFLQYVRDEVHSVDTSAGNYADVLLGDTRNRCLVVVDIRRYSKHALLLAEKARAAGVVPIILTDKYCDWAAQCTPHVIRVSTDTQLFWNSEVPLACAVNLLANSVITRLGPKIEKRLDQYSELYQSFIGHVGVGNSKRSRK